MPLPDHRVLLASGSEDCTIRVWDLISGVTASEDGPTGPVTTLTALRLPGAQHALAAGYADGTVHVWDSMAGRTVRGPVFAPSRHPRGLLPTGAPVTALAVVEFPSRPVLVAATKDGIIELVELATLLPVRTLDVGMPVSALAAAPEQRLAIATDEGVAMLHLEGIPRRG